MSKSTISCEVYKYPYCGRIDETEGYLSEKICSYTIKVRKKFIKKCKWLIVYGDLVIRLSSGIVPSQAIGLGIPPKPPAIMKFSNTNTGLSKQAIISQVIQQMPDGIDFTEKELDELYKLVLEFRNNSLSQEELIAKTINLRGGAFIDFVTAIAIISGMLVLLGSDWGSGFQPNPNAVNPPHLEWSYGNQQPGNHFGYGGHGKGAGPRSVTITGMTQNAGSDKKDPSSGSWDYVDVMCELEKKSSKKIIYIQVGDQSFTLKNPYRETAYELGDRLAGQIYKSIRESDTDICDIAENLGFKADNIKNVKDHVFYNEHNLDRYGPDEIERKQFDPDLQQALAWKRLETGTHTQNDITWIKHECAERHHELKYDSGYSEAHNRAQTLFDGAPWENEF